jgi:hypothetical protein
LIATAPNPVARGRQARLTRKGLAAGARYRERSGAIETRWAERLGAEVTQRLRALLEELATGSGDRRGPLWLGLDPPPGSWRSKLRRPEVLPHFPMPRQSGHPDGA